MMDGFNDLLGEVKPKARAFGHIFVLFDAEEFFKKMRHCVRWDADAGITDKDGEFVGGFIGDEADAHRSARRRVFDGVGDKIQGGLIDHVAVGFDGEEDGSELIDEGDLFFAGGGHGDLEHLLEDAVEGDGLFDNAGHAGLDAADVEDVVDEAREAVGFGLDDVVELGAGFVVGGFAVHEQFRVGLDAGKRGAQFVRDVGDEVGFHLGDLVFARAVVEHGDDARELVGVVGDAGERDVEGAGLAFDFKDVFGGAAVHAGVVLPHVGNVGGES